MSDKLRAAAKAALEELIVSESNAWNIINDLEAALAEPAQEPMHPEMKKMYEDYFDKCLRESSAQQRRWVGLTDEEISETCDTWIIDSIGIEEVIFIVRRTERAHGIGVEDE